MLCLSGRNISLQTDNTRMDITILFVREEKQMEQMFIHLRMVDYIVTHADINIMWKLIRMSSEFLV